MDLCTKTQTRGMERQRVGASGAAWRPPGLVERKAENAPRKGSGGLQPLPAADRAGQREEGRASSHCPPAPSPGDSGRLLLQGTVGQCCPQARGSQQVPGTGLYTAGFLTPPGGASRPLRGLGLAILRHPQAFWTILNGTVKKLLWVYVSNITLSWN